MKNAGLLLLLGGAAYLLTRKPAAAISIPYPGNIPQTLDTPGFDSTPLNFNTQGPAVAPAPDIQKQTSSPLTSLGEVIGTAKQIDQGLDIIKAAPAALAKAAPAVAAALSLSSQAPAVAASLAAPAAAPAAVAAVAPAGASFGAVALGALPILAPIAAVWGLFDALATNEDNRPENLAKRNAAMREAELPKYGVYGSGGTGTYQDINKSPLSLQQETGTRFKPGNQ